MTTKNIKKETDIVAVTKKEISPMIEQANDLEIAGPKDMEKAGELLSQLNLANDKVTERMETITLPAKQTIKAAEAIWKPFIVNCKSAISIVREKISDYQTEQTRIAQEKKDKIAERVGEGKGKLQPSTAVAQMESVQTPEAQVSTDSGLIKFRTDRKFEITDFRSLPAPVQQEIYEAAIAKGVADTIIRAHMKAGNEFAGVRYWDAQVPVNLR
jgi:hypothetical protein